MKITTCGGCKFEGACQLAADFRARAKGMRITSVKFKCPFRRNIYEPGQPVLFTTYYSEPDGSEYGRERCEAVYPGTVIEQMGRKVFGFIKPGVLDEINDVPFEPHGGGNGYVKIPLARVKSDEDRAFAAIETCSQCGSHYGLSGFCGGDNDPWLRRVEFGCLAAGFTKETAP